MLAASTKPEATSAIRHAKERVAPTMTRNLFWGRGEGEHALTVIAGQWPTDISGHAFIVGPDKREPGDHWFFGHGLLCRIDCRPDAEGKIRVRHRLIDTPMKRVRDRYPKLFRKVFGLLEGSPFGMTNFANTNVQAFAGRLFIGYDAGRPIEIDPGTLDYLTPVGAVDEWAQVLPAPLEPLITVAAHPAPDWEERALYFVNYVPISPSGAAETYLARWDLEGKVRRFRLSGMSKFDSIHDVKATRDYLILSDLPFVQEVAPSASQGRVRNQNHTLLWIVKKVDLRAAKPGAVVPVIEVRIDRPTGHLTVDYAPGPNGEVTVYLQHAQGMDLTLALDPTDRVHGAAERGYDPAVDPDYYGLPAFGPQPLMVGRYRIEPHTGRVLEAKVCSDAAGVWGPLLATSNQYTHEAQQRPRQLWFGGMGFDPALLSERYVALYADPDKLAVPLEQLPTTARSGGIQRFDLESMQVADVYHYANGAFPHPPTFIPRTGCKHELDGYVLAPVHQNGAKEIHIFDAARLAAGPVARAGASDFCPPLLLHSYWMADPTGPRPSGYSVSLAQDLLATMRGAPMQIVRAIGSIMSEAKKQRTAKR